MPDTRNRLVIILFLVGALIPPIIVHRHLPVSSLQAIKQDGVITVLTSNNANCYYIYQGQPMGFEYELARQFADSLGVALEIKTPGWSGLIPALKQKKGDFIAAGMTRTAPRSRRVAFSQGYMDVQQQVVIHKHNYAISEVADLAGQTVHVRQDTSYQQRLQQLQADGLALIMVLHKDVATEELIQKVAEKKIDLTVADSNIAQLNRRYYPDIKIAFPISEKQQLAWAVRPGDKKLHRAINQFWTRIKNNGTLARIHDRYYSGVEIFDYVDLKKFHQRLETRLPRYQSVIKKEAGRYDFDWRMIAAVIYQESHFHPLAKSYTGVRGLMQLTQTTAREMGIDNRLDPRQSIRGGVRYLAKMARRFKEIQDPRTRLLFALASYNIGYGHVRDAQKLAEEKGLPPNKWESLEQTLPLLRNRKYYKKTRYGYARGTEPVRYINRILTYYDILKQKAVSAEAPHGTGPNLSRRPPQGSSGQNM